jgi:hypothetical protein
MFGIKKVAPSCPPCTTHGKLYVIGLGQWRLMLLRSPTAALTSIYVAVTISETEQLTLSLAICGWCFGGLRNRD